MTDADATKQEILRVLRAQSGDRAALDELFQSVQSSLFRYIRAIVGDMELAEDVLQNVFVLIYRKLYWLRDPALFRPWAYRIASREAFRTLKRERRWTEQVRDEATLAAIPSRPEEEQFDERFLEMLPQLLERVSPSSRAVLILHYLEEMPMPEVAAVLGVPLGTVKSRLSYGLATLRKALDELGDTPL